MKYIVLEIQTNTDGTVGTIVMKKDTLNEAQSAFYSVLASAAISTLPVHSAVLLTNRGTLIESKTFDRNEVEDDGKPDT